MESRAIKIFSDAGFEAELDIVAVTQSNAQVNNIRLRREGEEFLRIDKLSADYVWPDIRDGKFTQIEFEGVAGRLELGEDWTPAKDWYSEFLPSGSGGGAESEFPEKGIRLTDGVLTLLSPLGESTLYMDAHVSAPKRFTAEITLAPSDLSYGGYSAKGAGVVMLERSGGNVKVQGQTQTDTLSNTKLQIADAHLRWDGSVNLEERSYAGQISVDGKKITGDLFEVEAARLSWDGTANLDAQSYVGKISGETEAIVGDLFEADATRISWDGNLSNADERLAKGQWSIAADRARTPRPARAKELADTLSLFPAMSVVPVTEHYAPELKQTVETFLLGADVNGQGTFEYSPQGFMLAPIGAISLQTRDNSLRLVSRPDADFFAFDAEQTSILAKMDAKFKRPVGLTLSDIELRAKSNNGVVLDGIESFSAGLVTTENWTALDAESRDVRLGPLTASMKYTGGVNPRLLSIDTALDYDGALPGSRVEDLNLEGRMDVRLFEGRQELDFIPKAGSRITMKSLETPTAWTGEDMSFNLPPTENFFTRTVSESKLAATLQMADFTLTQPATSETAAQRLDIQSAGLKLDGRLFPDKTQNWIVDFQDVRYASETLPGPGTTASAAQANLTARLVPEEAPKITLNTPSVTAETPLARLSNFEVSLSGTPDRYNVEHQNGTVDVIGSEFSQAAEKAGIGSFPANGRVEFVDGRFIGTAKLVVAKADNADVNVAYEYANGAGRADIDIPSILFKPQGLQPQTLVPAFRGKIARVEGEARAKINIGFADGALTDSEGTVELVDMAVGTAPGPVTGLNTTMRFASLWPLETDGKQRLTLESFNPGMPLEDGIVTYNLVPDGVQVYSADWPIGNGAFSLDPFTWSYGAVENRVTMRVKNVALGDFLNDLGNRKIQATGNVVGEFPIVVRGIEVLVEEGTLSVPDGGVITYDPGPNVPSYSESEAIAVLRQRRSAEYAFLAQDALREFRYKELSATIDGPLEGDVEIGLIFDGSNAKVLNRQPFRFDISVRGELFNIARSFNSNAQVKSEILRQNGQLPEGTIIGE